MAVRGRGTPAEEQDHSSRPGDREDLRGTGDNADHNGFR